MGWHQHRDVVVNMRLVALRAPCSGLVALSRVSRLGQRWWGALAVASQQATFRTLLSVWMMPMLPNAKGELPVAEAQQAAAAMGVGARQQPQT